jgi:hypothetical protein
MSIGMQDVVPGGLGRGDWVSAETIDRQLNPNLAECARSGTIVGVTGLLATP